MPNIFDASDPKAVPDAPTGRSVPDFPMAAALDNETDVSSFSVDMTPEPEQGGGYVDSPPDWAEPVEEAEETPVGVDATAELMALHAEAEEPKKKPAKKKAPAKKKPEPVAEEAPPAVEETGGSEVITTDNVRDMGEVSIDVNTGEATVVREPEPAAEPVAEPEPVEEPAADDAGTVPDVEPGGGFVKGAGADEAAGAVTRLMTALIASAAKNQSVPRDTVEQYMSPLFDVANRGERVAVREELQKLQATAVHGMRFDEVISIQHALDFAEERFASGARTRKTAEERAHEKRVKDSREGAAVLIAVFELLKSLTPDGVDVTSVARKDSEAVIAEVGQHVRWLEGGSVPEQEPKISPLSKRAVRVFKSAVKGISLEGELKPTVSQVVNVKDEPHKVSAPDEPVRDRSARIHVESLFARLQPGQWVSVQQVVDQPSNEYPDKDQRPTAAAVKAVLYGEGVEPIDGVEGFTHEGVDGGWKPVAN